MCTFKVGDKVRLKSAAEIDKIDTYNFRGQYWLDKGEIKEGVTYQVSDSNEQFVALVGSGLGQWAAYFELAPKSVGFMIDDAS